MGRKVLAALLLAALPWAACAQEDMQRAIQRALIQLDQHSAEFAAQLRGQDVRELQSLHAEQLRDAGREPLPYERMRMTEERELRLPPPVVRVPQPPYTPLPLPGGPAHIVEPVAPPSAGQ